MLFTLVSSMALPDIHYFALTEVALRIIYIQAYWYICTSVCLKQALLRNRSLVFSEILHSNTYL